MSKYDLIGYNACQTSCIHINYISRSKLLCGELIDSIGGFRVVEEEKVYDTLQNFVGLSRGCIVIWSCLAGSIGSD